MNDKLQLKLQAWIDGEVSPFQARRLARLVQRDAQASQLVRELRTARQLLAANPPARVVPEAREFYWAKIERQIHSQARQPAPLGLGLRWRAWMTSLAAVAALAALFLVVVKQYSPAASFDEVSDTADGMEAITFHDQTTGMTAVWLQDSQDNSSTQPGEAAPELGDNPDLQM